MAGHSKWSTIKHKKILKDQKKSKLFSKLINNIKTSLTTESIPSYKLKNAIDKALDNNVNKNTITKFIEKTMNYNTKTLFLCFKNNQNIIIILEVLNNSNTFSDIKYTLNTFSFINIPFEKITNNIFTLIKITLTNMYNELLILTLLKHFSIKCFIDSYIIVHQTDSMKITTILHDNIISLIKTPQIEFKTHIYEKNNKTLDLLYKKFQQKSYIKNIFINTCD
ncbi:MAG TPA: hypothetical protein V7792_00865 [Candidatus Azoamicus sp. OHIO2]